VADRPTSLVALRVAAPDTDVGALVASARSAGDLDRATPLADARTAAEVLWGGRLQRAAVRALDDDGAHLLRTEVALGADGFVADLARQAVLLQALARHVPEVLGVRDLSARTDHDAGWLERAAASRTTRADAVAVVVGPARGRTPGWIRTHGAARFGVPDLELYGLAAGAEDAAVAALGAVHDALLAGGMAAPLALPDGARVRLVPVLEAWARLPLGWPGIGRAGEVRGPGLDGPRATLSVLHRARLGRHRLDLEGVVARLGAGGVTPR
jgi:hypothetical protein